MQDSASSYKAIKVRLNLYCRQIPYIKFPLYYPNLNFIKYI
jgi:hypothetical protein